jgi:hypothetical protein
MATDCVLCEVGTEILYIVQMKISKGLTDLKSNLPMNLPLKELYNNITNQWRSYLTKSYQIRKGPRKLNYQLSKCITNLFNN